MKIVGSRTYENILYKRIFLPQIFQWFCLAKIKLTKDGLLKLSKRVLLFDNKCATTIERIAFLTVYSRGDVNNQVE